MFLQIGKWYINSSQVKRIRLYDGPNQAQRAEIEMIDGTFIDDFFHHDKAEALTRQYFPAPQGYEHLEPYPNERGGLALRREAVVAFAYQPGSDGLLPITAETGLLENHALKTPAGRVHTFFEIFASETDFAASHKKAEAA